MHPAAEPSRPHHSRFCLAASCVAVLSLTLATAPAAAGAQTVVGAIAHDVRAAGADIWWVWTSPFHASARDWRDAATVVGAAAVVSPFDERVDHWIVTHPSAGIVRAVRPPRDESGFQFIGFGTGNVILPLSAGIYVVGLAGGGRSLRDAGMGCIASQQSNSIVRGLVYTLVKRDRPGIANGDAFRFGFPGSSWNHHSFFGGHVANAMSCASYTNNRFRLGAPGKLLYLGAAAIGLGRMADRQHWSSDIFLGASFGYAIGRSVAIRQRRRLAREQGSAMIHSDRQRRDAAVDRALSGLYVGAGERGRPALGWRTSF